MLMRISAILFLYSLGACNATPYSLSATSLPLSKDAHITITFTKPTSHYTIMVTPKHLLTLTELPNKQSFTLTPNKDLGTAQITILSEEKIIGTEPITIKHFTEKDADHDGFPDVSELISHDDRNAFQYWFAAIAESQFHKVSSQWKTHHHDCAGLLRFAYVEALKPHSNNWHNNVLQRPGIIGADINRFHYPQIPILGENIFQSGEPQQPFSNFASAKILMEHNTIFIGKQISQAQHGDLLFYTHTTQHGQQIHSMIFLSELMFETNYVVYHTGPKQGTIPDGSGEVRKVPLAELLNHHNDQWHPQPSNPAFLGFYRWKILS